MSTMSTTPHNTAKVGEIAKTVIMPGDPRRAKYFAEQFLEDAKCVNEVRGMLAYTGTYKGKEVTVMGHGMGMPSMAIYAYELYTVYGAEQIIRFGTCGGYDMDMDLYDVIIANTSYTETDFGRGYGFPEPGNIDATPELVAIAEEVANTIDLKGHKVKTGPVRSGDWFYSVNPVNVMPIQEWVDKYGILGGEMESYALNAIATSLGKKSLTLVGLSDHSMKKTEIHADERERGLTLLFDLILGIVERI